MIRSSLPLVLGFLAIIACAPAKSENDLSPPWVHWDKQDGTGQEPTTYLKDGSTQGPIVIVASVAQLSEMYGAALPDDPDELLEVGLSVLWIDVVELDRSEAPKTGGRFAAGAAETEHGSRSFAARLSGGAADDAMVVFLTPDQGLKGSQIAGYLGEEALQPVAARPETDRTPSPEKRVSEKPKATKSTPYPAPIQDDDDNLKGWTYLSDTHAVAAPDDPNAPSMRVYMEAASRSAGPSVALKKALAAAKIKQPKHSGLNETKIAKSLVGSRNLFVLGRSRMPSKDAIFFAQVFQTKSDSGYSVKLIQMDEPTYKAWGGIAAMASATGVIDAPTDIPTEYRNQLANASLEQQMAFYHMAYTQVMKNLFAGFMSVNTGTLTMMQNMNYDMLFNGEVTLDSLDTNP